MNALCLLLAAAAVANGQFLPTELPSTCASTTCLVGTPCREVLNPTSGIVSGRCLSNPPQRNERICSVGQPLLINSASGATTEAFCGRGLNRITCPSGWSCNIAPNDAYAVCCQDDGVNPAPTPAPTLPPAPQLTCANMLCQVGYSCREVYQPDGTVSPQCLRTVPDAGSQRVCASGQTLLSQETTGADITVSYCGLGARRGCPSGYWCNVHPADAYAVCCKSVVKEGKCPVPAPGEVGICASTCQTDDDCGGQQKCCRNGCGANVCQNPDLPPSTTCETMKCGANQTCEMLPTPCAPGSTRCDPVPTCVDKKEKAGQCPAVVNNGNTFGICAFMCNSDNDCRGDEKCCKNECGGTVCKDPVSSNPVRTCATTRCGSNQRCEMQQVQCIRAPCDPVPMCVDIERDGVCPKPSFTWDLFWRARCQRDCESDSQCPGFRKCCNDYYGCGTKCENPEPTATCQTAKCSRGFYCVMQQVQCVRAPCFPVPNCVEIAKACNPGCKPGYKCQLEMNRFTRTQQPTCVMDPENPPCNPVCSAGFECKLQQPWWCFWNCSPRPTCVRSRNCPMYPAWVNPNCVRQDTCSESNPFSCTGNTICCSTDCGRRCVTPLE